MFCHLEVNDRQLFEGALCFIRIFQDMKWIKNAVVPYIKLVTSVVITTCITESSVFNINY